MTQHNQVYCSTIESDCRCANSAELAVFMISRTEMTLFSKKQHFFKIFEGIESPVSVKMNKLVIMRQ